MLTILIGLLAFIVGYVIRRGSICAVAATRAFIVERRSKRLRAFGVAVAAAGVVILPLHWMVPDAVHLSIGYPASLTVVLAGGLYAIGARFNDACALGTLAHLTGGRMSYVMTPLGAMTGILLVLTVWPNLPLRGDALPSALAEPSSLALATLVAFLGVVAVTTHRRGRVWWLELLDVKKDRLGPFRAMLVIGTLSGLLYALIGGWTHMDLLSRQAASLAGQTSPDHDGMFMLTAVILILGGVSAALRTGQFRIRWPGRSEAARCLFGGLIMGISAAVIPGGNGILLVHGLPSLAPHALAAYAAMTALLCVSFLQVPSFPSNRQTKKDPSP